VNPSDDLETPVVFIVFNRPETTRQVFERISRIRPKTLFLIADGPRPEKPDDPERCKEVRKIVQSVDWDCDVHYDFSDENLGTQKRISSGLDRVFSEVERAIILEDDCVPDYSFFPYCAELLERYQDDCRVMVISGDNFQFGRHRTSYSYYFSRYNHCWGWATWQRAWRFYDDRMDLWPTICNGNWLDDILDNDRRAVAYWHRIFQSVYERRVDSWAYRWTFACWIESGLTALPQRNLVSNIGFGSDATHTRHRSRSSAIPAQPLEFPLRHPPFVIRDSHADHFTQGNHFGTSLSKTAKRMVIRLLSRFAFLRFESAFRGDK